MATLPMYYITDFYGRIGMLDKKRVFISGGAGVIGNALTHKLHAQGAHLLVGDLKPHPHNFPRDVRYRLGDLNYLTQEEISDFDPELFIHLAATFERSTETSEFWSENFHHNVNLSYHLGSLLKNCPSLEKIVFASSYLIYDPALYSFDSPQLGPRTLSEKDPILPRNLCGAAKLYHEMELHFLEQFIGECRIINARIFRGYGRGSRDVISRWVRDLLDGKALTVFRKEGQFDYIYADDTAEALMRLAASSASGIVNVGTGRARRVSDILDVLSHHFPEMNIMEGDADIAYEGSQADNSRLKAITGWEPAYRLEEAIPEIIEFESNLLTKLNATLQSTAKLREEGNAKPSFSKPVGVMITSVSRKIPMVHSVRHALRKLGQAASIIGADANSSCLGQHFVDQFWQMPPLSALSIEALLAYCQDNNVRFIIPSRDGELIFFARAKAKLAEHGIAVMVSDECSVNDCLDKLRFAEILRTQNVPAIPTVVHFENLTVERLVVKERFGAASQGISLNVGRDEAAVLAAKLTDPIFQPFVDGKEYSVDLFIDRNRSCKGVVARHRELVIGGESQITTTVSHPRLEALCSQVAELLGLYGHAVFQVIVDQADDLHIVECNPRFGGASTLSLSVGLDSLYWFLLEGNGADLDHYPFARKAVQQRQVRFPCDEVFVVS
jgi:carbamoyl-phosphate synthase large subunit